MAPLGHDVLLPAAPGGGGRRRRNLLEEAAGTGGAAAAAGGAPAVAAAAVLLSDAYTGRLPYSAGMRMSFDVGVEERHQVQVSFNKFWGAVSIKVDGRSVVRTIRMGSIDLVKHWDFVVGTNERHNVRVEKHRERILGAFRPQPFRAYVDGQLVAEEIG